MFCMIHVYLDEWAHTLYCAPRVLFTALQKITSFQQHFYFPLWSSHLLAPFDPFIKGSHFAKHDPCVLCVDLVSRGGLNSSHTNSLMWTLSQVSLDTASAVVLLGAKGALLWNTKGKARQQLARLCQGLESCCINYTWGHVNTLTWDIFKVHWNRSIQQRQLM